MLYLMLTKMKLGQITLLLHNKYSSTTGRALYIITKRKNKDQVGLDYKHFDDKVRLYLLQTW